MSPFTIRNADPERDAAACAAIYAPSVEDNVTSFEERAPDAAELSARIASISASHPWLVGEEGGEVVGFAYACTHRERGAYRWAVDVSVYVAAGQRGRGHGRALYEELFERLRRQRFQVACAGITLPNEASVTLHKRLGFVAVGVNRRIGWKRGAWRDVGWWQLELVPAGDDEPAEPLPPEPPPAAG
ncbi:MAG: N-acetyltransferase [Solirubrobacterales bacterium]|nr:N-acetyltransferase [Solirubrobacterales bacterium]